LVNESGETVFRTPQSIHFLIQNNGTLEFVKELLTLKDHEGRVVFHSGDDIVDMPLVQEEGSWKYDPAMVEKVRGLINLKDPYGKTVFRDGKDVIFFLEAYAPLRSAKRYIATQKIEGGICFNGNDLQRLKYSRVSPSYATRLATTGLNAATIVYYYHLGLTEDHLDFKNSGKPKALIIYATSDDDKSFVEEEEFSFLRKIKRKYDIKIRAVSTVNEFYAELEKSPQLDLLLIGGHGLNDNLEFGCSLPKYRIEIGEEGDLRIGTQGLKERLEKVRKGGVIYLESCCTGEGRGNAKNLANHVAECAPARRVISCTREFDGRHVKVKKLYPLDLSIINGSPLEDCTYVVTR